MEAESTKVRTETDHATMRSRIALIVCLAISAAALIATNTRFTILDDEATITSVAAHPVLPTLLMFLTGGSQHEHPPLSDILLHGWLLITNYSFVLLRVFANIFYLAGAVVLALVAKRLSGNRGYWAAIVLSLLWPFCFQYGRIAGWYAFCWFLIALLTLEYVHILERGSQLDWIAFGVCGVLLVWSNYFGLVVLLLLMLDLLVFHRDIAKSRIRSLVAVIAAVFLVSLPLLRLAAQNVAGKMASASPANGLKGMIATVGYPVFSVFASTAIAPWYLPLSVPVFLASVLLIVSVWRSEGRRWMVYWAVALATLAVTGHIGVKNMLFLLPWFFLAVVFGIAGKNARMPASLTTACAILLIGGWAGIISGRHYATTNLYEPWPNVARVVSNDARNGAIVISENLPFFFYLDYQLGVMKEAASAEGAYLGRANYQKNGYTVLSPDTLPPSSIDLHGKIVVVNGSSLPDAVETIQALESQLVLRCRKTGEFHAAPDPAAALKARFAEDVATLNYRTNVTWFECP